MKFKQDQIVAYNRDMYKCVIKDDDLWLIHNDGGLYKYKSLLKAEQIDNFKACTELEIKAYNKGCRNTNFILDFVNKSNYYFY